MFSAFILPLYIVITKVIFFNIPTSLYKYLKVEGIQINGKIKTTPLIKRSGSSYMSDISLRLLVLTRQLYLYAPKGGQHRYDQNDRKLLFAYRLDV